LRKEVGYLLLLALGALACGCDRSDAPVREWTAKDHDPPARPTGAPGGRVSDAGTPPGMGGRLFESQCARCHGLGGKGDGPDGRPLGTPDISRHAWQAGATDEAIASVIESGRGAMPPFQLGAPAVRALVSHVRSLGAVPGAPTSVGGPSPDPPSGSGDAPVPPSAGAAGRRLP
jgi:cytochrome c5